jgi:hypothetical protein
MNHQFKPGDLALIVGGNHPPFNTGRACTIVCLAKPGDKVNNPHNDARYLYLGDDVMWLVEGPSIENDSPDPEDAGLDLIEDRFLIPLRGEFAPEQAISGEVSA